MGSSTILKEGNGSRSERFAVVYNGSTALGACGTGWKPVPQAVPRHSLYVAALILAGYLLFCHGCHGDEDNELFTLTGMRSASSTGH
jgi:hypothetical protein